MAQRWHRFSVTSPKGNGPINSELLRTDFTPGYVVAIRVQIPSGHHDLTGIRVIYGDAQIIPRAENTWLKGNHHTETFSLDDPLPGGVGWFVEHYNSDRFYDHTFHVSYALVDAAELDLLFPPVIWLRGADATPDTESGGVLTPIPGAPGAS